MGQMTLRSGSGAVDVTEATFQDFDTPTEDRIAVCARIRFPNCRNLIQRARAKIAHSDAGMTLVELMVAISLIALILSGLALSITVDYKAIALTRSRQVAENVANQQLEQLRDVDYSTMALNSTPLHSVDPTNPDYYVSGANYDVTGTGQNEALIVQDGSLPPDFPVGPIDHTDTPLSTTIGTTQVDIYRYVTWVDDPSIPGLQNLKRLSVVVKYVNVPTVGGSRVLRESVVLTNGTVVLPDNGTPVPPPAPTTTSTSSSTTTTTAPAGVCGSFSIAGSSGASIGYTASTTVTITMALTGCPGTVLAGFSNNGGSTWSSPDITYSSTSPNLAQTLTTGDGTKTIAGRVRNGSSGTWTALVSQSIILDTTMPTTPASISRTVSCSGNTRTTNLTWSAATDTYLVGYHVYASSDGTVWVLQSSTSALTKSTPSSKVSTTYYRVKAYDAAGNESSATTTIALSKNQCS